MKARPIILHIIDDATAGGVNRVVDFLVNSETLARHAEHKVQQIKRGKFSAIPKNIDMIVSHTVISWRTLPALIALRAARPTMPIVHVEHSYTESFVNHNVKRKARFSTLLRVGFSLFDRVIAVSEGQAQWMKTRRLCPEARLVTIPSCVDLSTFRAIKAPEGPIKTLGAIGRLDRQKGFDLLISAFKALPDKNLRLRVFGQGTEEAALKSLAGTDTRIEFMGYTAAPTEAFEAVDIVVMPSRWEAFGLVAIEACAAKRPVLCAPTDGMQDHARFGARFFDVNSPNGLFNALADYSSTDEGKQSTAIEHSLLEMEQEVIGKWSVVMELAAPDHHPSVPMAQIGVATT